MPVEARSGSMGTTQRCCSPLEGENSCGQSSAGVAAARTVGEQKKEVFFKYINGKRQCKIIIGPFQDGNGHLTSRDRDKAEVFNTSFVSVFNVGHRPRGSQCPELRTMTVPTMNSQST